MAQRKTLFRETTEVPVNRSVGSIQDLLVQAGARSISMEFSVAGKIEGINFSLPVRDRIVKFALPARVEPVFRMLHKKRAGGRGRFDIAVIRAQAERVAWRQLFAWCEAQVAMIQTGMAEPAEVFLPYAVHTATGQSCFQVFVENTAKMLPAPEGAFNG